MAKDITEWTHQCIACQNAKIHTHVSPPPSVIPIPECHFSHIHVDLVGPLSPSQGCTHIFTTVDKTTRWTEAEPLSTTTATSCAETLCSAWICRFGIPHTITSDRGTQFTSSIRSQFSSVLHSSHITTTAFHPQSNGMVGQFHRRLKDTLRACCSSPDWVAHLSWCLLAFCSSPHELSNSSPAGLFLSHHWYCL
jgi:transposase InsO family protein